LGQLLEGTQLSLDLDESINTGLNSQLSSSPPNTGRLSPTQPNTPQAVIQEPLELQVDYWPISRPILDGKEKNQAKSQDQGKNSVKSTFKNLQVSPHLHKCLFNKRPHCNKSSSQVWRLPLNPISGTESSYGLTLCFAAKEKKQKSEFPLDFLLPFSFFTETRLLLLL
jgi:hypothetical protein